MLMTAPTSYEKRDRVRSTPVAPRRTNVESLPMPVVKASSSLIPVVPASEVTGHPDDEIAVEEGDRPRDRVVLERQGPEGDDGAVGFEARRRVGPGLDVDEVGPRDRRAPGGRCR